MADVISLRQHSERAPRATAHAIACALACALAVLPSCTPPASAGIEARDGGADASDAGKATAALAGDGAAPVATARDGGREDEALPPSTSDDLTARAKHLLEAIAQDNPELASDILFPRDAFLASRDSPDAARGWEKTINGPFSRSVHALHKRMKGLERAQFVSVELGRSVVQVTPKKKDWKKPLWKVRHSRLTVSIDARSQRIEIAELMSWRGAWYVTKLR